MRFDVLSFAMGQQAGKSGGSGGGSLPTGLYYEPMSLRAASSYDEVWVMLNNERYAITSKYNSPASMVNAYKMDDVNNAKTQIISDGKTNLTSNTILSLEFNGKVHLWENTESYRHVTFDGSAFTICADIGSGSYYYDWLFVQDNKLKAYEGGTGKVFVWNESDDTWTEEASVFSSRTTACFVNVNGTVYVVSGGKIYTYDGTTVTQIGSIAKSAANMTYFAKDNCLYWYDNSNDVRKYDLTTNIETVIGKTPLGYGAQQVGLFWEYDGKLCFQYHHYYYTKTMGYYVHIIE